MNEKFTKNKFVKTTEESNIIDHLINLRRVTKVTKGGKRFAFSALVVSGDQGGKVGIALGKGREVSSAIAKATTRARKNMIEMSLRDQTIPYGVMGSHGASKVVLRPAYKGTGIVAGGAVRLVLDALGIKDILAKSVKKSSSRQNLAKATLNALAKLRTIRQLSKLRGINLGAGGNSK